MLNILTSYYYMHFKQQLMNQTWENGKNLILDTVLVCLTQICHPKSSHQNCFSKIWLRQTLDIMVSYHHIQYQKKNNDPILRKHTDGQTDDRPTDDGSDFIGCCPTNAEHQNHKIKNYSHLLHNLLLHY